MKKKKKTDGIENENIHLYCYNRDLNSLDLLVSRAQRPRQ